MDEYDFDYNTVEFTRDARCDRCGARAYVQSSKQGFSELIWCAHHLKANLEALEKDGWEIFYDTASMAEDLGEAAFV